MGRESGTEFRVLGPVEALADGRSINLGHAKQRCVLAVLLVEAGRVVPVEQLIDRVWGEEPPASVRSVLYGYVARLRAALRTMEGAAAEPPAARLGRRSGGYVLDIDPDLVDLHRFRGLVAEAAAASGGDERVIALLREAVTLWRGEALAGLSGDWVDGTRARLDGEQLAAQLALGDAGLRLGLHSELLAELRGLADAHPLDERVVRQLIQALHQCELQAAALEEYERTRVRLSEELGVDPGPELQALRQRILLGGQAATPASGAGTPAAASAASVGGGPREHSGPRLAPAELPRAVPGFSGRADAVARLHSLVPPEGAGSGTGAVVISAIGGTAGVGKTALAIHWCHQVRDQFPDGQLYVDLCGFDRSRAPLRPRDALTQLLSGLGLTPQEIPAAEDEQIRRYRSLLVDRRMLIVLDDAASAEQVRPLLPGTSSCFVVVTSRNRLGGLVAREGAHPLILDVLAPKEAHALLVEVIGAARTAAEPEAAEELARLCGYLPLALRVAAAQLAIEPGRRVADLTEELAEGSRLAVLEMEDDEPSAVRAAFELSYRRLAPEARLLFRRLGLVPGLDFDAGAAAALLDTAGHDAERALGDLATVHLIESRGGGRYGFHDLLREYANERYGAEDSPEDLAAARDRLYTWYLRGALAAAQVLYPQIPRLPHELVPATPGNPAFTPGTRVLPVATLREPVSFADEGAALGWLEAQRQNLLATVERTVAEGPRAVSWHLADAMIGYFWLCLPRGTWQVTAQSALDAAVAEGDLLGEAAMYYSLGYTLWDQGRLGESAFHHTRAVELHQAIDWRPGVGAALSGLGWVEWEQARLDDALGNFSAAIQILREYGQSVAEALALIGVGMVHRDMGRLQEAARDLELALLVRRKATGGSYEANHLDNLGIVYWENGRLRDALDVLSEALALNEAVGYRNGHAVSLLVTARVLLEYGRHAESIDLGERALRLVVDTGNRRIQADALNTLADGHRRAGDASLAVETNERALLAARAAENRRAEADSLLGLAVSLRCLGRYEEALTRAEDAAALARRSGFRLVEGQTLTERAEIHTAMGHPDQARPLAEEARTVQADTGHRLGEARALSVLARALDALGDPRSASAARERAQEIYEETGARP